MRGSVLSDFCVIGIMLLRSRLVVASETYSVDSEPRGGHFSFDTVQ